MKKLFLTGILLALCAACLCLAAACGNDGGAETHTIDFTFNGEKVTDTAEIYFSYEGAGSSHCTQAEAKDGKGMTIEVYLTDYYDANTLKLFEGERELSAFALDGGYAVEQVAANARKAGEITLDAVSADRTLDLTCDEYKIKLNFTETDEPMYPTAENPDYPTAEHKAMQESIYNSFEVWAGGSWRSLHALTENDSWTTYSELTGTNEPNAAGGVIRLRSERYPHGAFYSSSFVQIGEDAPQNSIYESESDDHAYYIQATNYGEHVFPTEIDLTLDKSTLDLYSWYFGGFGSVWDTGDEAVTFYPKAEGNIADFSFGLNDLNGALDLSEVKVFVFEEELTDENGKYTITKAPCEYEGSTSDLSYTLSLQGLEDVREGALNKVTLTNKNAGVTEFYPNDENSLYYWDGSAAYYPQGAQTTESVKVFYDIKTNTKITDFVEQRAVYEDLIDFKAVMSIPGRSLDFTLKLFLPGSGSVKSEDGTTYVIYRLNWPVEISYQLYLATTTTDGETTEYTYTFQIDFSFTPAADMQGNIS